MNKRHVKGLKQIIQEVLDNEEEPEIDMSLVIRTEPVMIREDRSRPEGEDSKFSLFIKRLFKRNKKQER